MKDLMVPDIPLSLILFTALAVVALPAGWLRARQRLTGRSVGAARLGAGTQRAPSTAGITLPRNGCRISRKKYGAHRRAARERRAAPGQRHWLTGPAELADWLFHPWCRHAFRQ